MKITDKIKNKANKIYKDTIDMASTELGQTIIKKDFSTRALGNNIEINKYFNYFSKNYLIVLGYLQDDFKQKVEYSGANIKSEIKIIKKTIKTYNREGFRRFNAVKVVDALRLKKLMNRWKLLNDFLEEYPKLLDFFFNTIVDGYSPAYKGINSVIEKDQLADAEYLKEDFSFFIKEMKKNGHDNIC